MSLTEAKLTLFMLKSFMKMNPNNKYTIQDLIHGLEEVINADNEKFEPVLSEKFEPVLSIRCRGMKAKRDKNGNFIGGYVE